MVTVRIRKKDGKRIHHLRIDLEMNTADTIAYLLDMYEQKTGGSVVHL